MNGEKSLLYRIDLILRETTTTADIEQNTAKGAVTLIGDDIWVKFENLLKRYGYGIQNGEEILLLIKKLRNVDNDRVNDLLNRYKR